MAANFNRRWKTAIYSLPHQTGVSQVGVALLRCCVERGSVRSLYSMLLWTARRNNRLYCFFSSDEPQNSRDASGLTKIRGS